MKNKNKKFIIVFFFMAICVGVIYTISIYKNYITTVNSLKFIEVLKMSEKNEDLSYLELKKFIDEKYNNQLSIIIEDAKKNYNSAREKLFGENYLPLIKSYSDYNNAIISKKETFLNSSEYLNAKAKLIKCKQKVDNCAETEYENALNEFKNALAEITTLNVKMNNQVKELNEKRQIVKTKLKKLYDEHRDEIIKIKHEEESKVLLQIKDILQNYTFEIKQLNSVYSVNSDEVSFNNKIVSTSKINNEFELDYFDELKEQEFSSRKENLQKTKLL